MSEFSSKYYFQSIRLGFTINGHDIDYNKVNSGSSFNDGRVYISTLEFLSWLV
jgi:hypothetical protein